MTAVQAIEARRPQRQDTFDLRGEIVTDEPSQRIQIDTTTHASDDDHSVLEDDSSNEDGDGDYMEEDDVSSSLSIPNESIDFDLVYSLHNFAATVEGQASVVKGDSLFLMDDSNSYWWLVRVLTTQEVGYIPAENIETPFERLARLNKHRNVDVRLSVLYVPVSYLSLACFCYTRRTAGESAVLSRAHACRHQCQHSVSQQSTWRAS